MVDKSELVVIAVCLGAHGVRGDVRIKSFSERPDSIFNYGPLLDEQGAVCVTPIKARTSKDQFIVTPKETRQKEEWDAMKGTLLCVPRMALPAAEENEFYISDLIGLLVSDPAGEALGRVKAVHNFGAGDLIEIDLIGPGQQVMVPLTEEDVPKIDLAGGKLVVATLQLWQGEDEEDKDSER